MTSLLNPKDLAKLAHEEELAKANKALEAMKRKEDEQRELHETFMNREIHPQVKERVNAAVERAARAGERELLVVSFPASYCNDAGRRINNAEPDCLFTTHLRTCVVAAAQTGHCATSQCSQRRNCHARHQNSFHGCLLRFTKVIRRTRPDSAPPPRPASADGLVVRDARS